MGHDIERCHGPVIIIFVNCKLTEKALENACNLKNMNLLADYGCSHNTNIFLGINLSPYFKALDFHWRHLKKVAKGFIKIKTEIVPAR